MSENIPDVLTKEDFCAKFKAYMLRIVGPKLSDGTSVADYADRTAQTYWDDPYSGECGPEECADADISCWE